MHNSLILALDIGTSSVRAALYDTAGNVLPDTMVKNDRALDSTEDGGAEIDADTAFKQVASAIDDVLNKAENIDGNIEYAASSAFWHSLMGVDSNGKPTTKVLGWADNRSRYHVSTLRKKFDETEIHNRTGTRFHPSYWTSKLQWLRKEQPEVFERTAKWISFSDYVGIKLFGRGTDPFATQAFVNYPAPDRRSGLRIFTSVSMASATGIFDIRNCDWDRTLIKYLKIGREQLPEIVQDAKITSRLSPYYQRRWKRLRHTGFFAAIGDGAANNIGTGCVSKPKAALMIGTSAAMRVAYKGSPPEKIPAGLWCYRIDRTRVIIGGALSDGGGLYGWLKDNLRLDADDAAVEKLIAKRAPAGHGLTFLPFMAGERSTGYNEFANGGIIGLTTSTGPIDIVQACLESVAYRFAEICDQLKTVSNIREITASGGALQESSAWTQIIADVLGRDLTRPDTREASSRGAVLLALETIGRIDSIETIAPPKGRRFVTDRKRHDLYKIARIKHAKLYGLFLTRTTNTQ